MKNVVAAFIILTLFGAVAALAISLAVLASEKKNKTTKSNERAKRWNKRAFPRVPRVERGASSRAITFHRGASSQAITVERGANSREINNNYRRKDLMTPSERDFYDRLRQVVGNDYTIFTKVGLKDVVEVPEESWSQRDHNKIAQKHLDFILCDPGSLYVVLAIELDDPTHKWKKHEARDEQKNEVLAIAGIALLRISDYNRYSLPQLRAEIYGRIRNGQRR